jgi:hypothetical protein
MEQMVVCDDGIINMGLVASIKPHSNGATIFLQSTAGFYNLTKQSYAQIVEQVRRYQHLRELKIKQLETALAYAPGGEAFAQAKQDFEERAQP